MMFVSNIVSANNGKPKKSDTHNSEKRDEMIDFLSISGFKPKTVRFLRFKNRFNRAKAVRVIANSTRSIIISNNVPSIRGIRRERYDDVSFKKMSSIKNVCKDFSVIHRSFNVSKVFSNKFTFRVIERKGKE